MGATKDLVIVDFEILQLYKNKAVMVPRAPLKKINTYIYFSDFFTLDIIQHKYDYDKYNYAWYIHFKLNYSLNNIGIFLKNDKITIEYDENMRLRP